MSGGKKQYTCLWNNNGMALFYNYVFTQEELAFLFYAMASLKYRDMVIYNFKDNPANRKDLADALQCSVSSIARTVAKLIDKNAIKYRDDKYHLNPAIGWKGEAVGEPYKDAVDFFSLQTSNDSTLLGKRRRKRVERKNGRKSAGKIPERYVITDTWGHRIPIYGYIKNAHESIKNDTLDTKEEEGKQD